ncbi:hypothetical protein G7Y89_g3433 [Cudoniella acicularis]|uniref:F-box domain-containing protein n=1 Tax=Cudoniella acicularis TaxID=354080 RepID=A0A8H4RTG6_9HELO|nr:hypothetical protein G7Y89_g3433 [Cudoniella acicularis]
MSSSWTMNSPVHPFPPSSDPFIDLKLLTRRCPLDNGRSVFTNPKIGPNSQNWSDSYLQKLPLEIYHACLLDMDIESLTVMRRVSQFTRSAIDDLLQYKDLYTHAPQALRACLSTQVANHIPLRRLHNSLSSIECYYCKTAPEPRIEFGGYLSLFEGRRSCLFCLGNNPELRPVELTALLCSRLTGSIGTVNNMALLKTIPGTYSPTRISVTTRGILVRGPSRTTELSNKERGTPVDEDDHKWKTYHHPLMTPESECNLDPSIHYLLPDDTKQVAQRYMTALRFPYLTSDRSFADWGTLCLDCALSMAYHERYRKIVQEFRRRHHRDSPASLQTRNFFNRIRKKACSRYVSKIARKDAKLLTLKEGQKAGAGMRMSMANHQRKHVGETLSDEERRWRERHRPKRHHKR